MDPTTPLIGGKFALPIAGVVGAFLSLAFVKNLKPLPAVMSVIGGAATATYCGPLIVNYMGWQGRYEELVGFILGFTGMNILGGLCSISRRFRADPIATLREIRSNEPRNHP